MNSANVCVVVATYNRVALLQQCLSALANQSQIQDNIIVVDNASTDGTSATLRTWIPDNLPCGELLVLNHNCGGAGGFSAGLAHAINSGAEWIWMMDDDACPYPTALEELLKVAKSPENIYGSLSVCGEHTSWATTLIDQQRIAQLASEVPAEARVESIPLLGFLIHSNLVEKIGYPDAEFFIAADDVEYCIRARRAGADIIIAGNSRIEHPRTQQKVINILGQKITYLSLPGWKRYYDTRNRLLIARKYYGWRLVTQTIPGSFVRLFAALRHEPRKLAQLWAFCAGMTDGLLGLKGRRHEKWHIPQ